jgi:hypothetical protein
MTNLQNGYRPSAAEPFMNDRQREYFRSKLLAWREDVLKEARLALQQFQDEQSKRNRTSSIARRWNQTGLWNCGREVGNTCQN